MYTKRCIQGMHTNHPTRFCTIFVYFASMVSKIAQIWAGILKIHPENIRKPVFSYILFSIPLETPENQRFPDVFRGYPKRPVAWNGLMHCIKTKFSFKNFFENYFIKGEKKSAILSKCVHIYHKNIWKKIFFSFLCSGVSLELTCQRFTEKECLIKVPLTIRKNVALPVYTIYWSRCRYFPTCKDQ